ncbi:hypothetical protein BDV18DRAFT_84168 [Aspergillus unguis]
MSFCPSRLLLSRLRARSPSCFATQKLRTELHYPRRFAGTRFLSDNASQSNTTTPIGIPVDLEEPALDHDIDPSSEGLVLADGDAVDSRKVAIGPNYWLEPANDVSHRSSGQKSRVGKIYYYQYNRDGLQHATPRYVSKDLFDSEMNARSKTLFHGVNIAQWRIVSKAIYDRKAQGVGLPTEANLLKLDEEAAFLLELLKRGHKEDFQERWQLLGKSKKADYWPRLALRLLEHYCRLVPDFLRITCRNENKPVFVMVSDCINHVLKFCPDLMDESLATECLHPDDWPVLLLPQRPVRIYVHYANRNDLHYAWRRVRERKAHMSIPSILCFMKRFTEFGDVESALETFEVVQRMAHPGFPLDSDSVMRHCCKLLTRDYVVGKGSERNFRVLPRLLELGIQPTRDLMNVVLSNAFKSGDSQVAQSIINYMKEQGLEPDAYTYLALLTDAVRNGDGDRISSLLREIEVREEVQRNPWILSKILHSHFVSISRGGGFEEDPEEIFYSMLSLYTRLHDTTPLKELGILPHHYTPSGDTQPSVVAVYLMIATYLRCPKSMANVEHLYSRFRRLVLANRKSIGPLAETDHTYNEFLVAFRANVQGLRPAIRLVEDMLHTASDKNVSRKLVNAGMTHSKPTELTWNLLMSCFVFNKQPLAADKVRAMMAKHGVECDLGTWNMIINNYANSQNFTALARSIKQMEREGIVADHYTLNPLRFLRDPERLWAALDELDRASDEYYAVEPTPKEDKEHEDDDKLLTQALQQMKKNRSRPKQ